MTALDRIRALPIWTGRVEIEPLGGGLTNVNFVVQDAVRKAVVRLGDDIALHHIQRSNELAASRAAFEAGVSPAVLHHEPGLLVLDFIEGRTLTAADMPGMLGEAVDLVARAHRTIPKFLRGPAQMFWPFHVIRSYVALLKGSQYAGLLPGMLAEAEALQPAVGPIEVVYGHNDLLPANFIHDGARLWLIDWDYGGFGSPLFDLGGLAANNGLNVSQETFVLERYFGAAFQARLPAYRAMKAAAALRETLWSMVSEQHSTLDFDYASYTQTNLAAYRAAMANL